jgi:hypothetical protein
MATKIGSPSVVSERLSRLLIVSMLGIETKDYHQMFPTMIKVCI